MVGVNTLIGLIVSFFIAIALIFWATPKFTPSTQTKTRLFSLALGIHCTSWAMLGTVAQAVQHGWALMPTYAGIIATMILGHTALIKVCEISRRHNTASLADFMGLRWPHVSWFSPLITLILCASVIPYIALQLSALTNMSEFILLDAPTNLAFWITGLLIMCVGVLSYSNRSLYEQGQALLYTSALATVLKLIALLAVMLFLGYVLYPDMTTFMQQMMVMRNTAENLNVNAIASSDNNTLSAWLTYLCYMLLGVIAVFCTPRQFHIAFVINRDPHVFAQARWQFSAILALMSLPVLPIALAGQSLINNELISADIFTLAIPFTQQAPWLTTLVILGVIAAAIPMIMVSTIACSIMIANNIISPIWVKKQIRQASERPTSLRHDSVLFIRRLTVVGFLIAAYLFFEYIAKYTELVFSGFVALAMIAQVFPSFVLGMQTRTVNLLACVAGMAAGIAIWLGYILAPDAFNGIYARWFISASHLEIHLLISVLLNVAVVSLIQPLCGRYYAHYNSQTTHDQVKRERLPLEELLTLCQQLLPSEDIEQMQQKKYGSRSEQYTQARDALANRLGSASTSMLLATYAQGQSASASLLTWAQQTQQLESEKQKAEAANKSKTRFLAAAGHDLMQPFNAAQLLSNILSEKTKHTELAPLSSDLHNALQHAETLLKDILDVTKLDSGAIQAKLIPVKVDAMLAPLVQEHSVIAQSKQVNFRYVPSRLLVTSDHKLLQRCCQNLIANAIRYTALSHPNGGGKVVCGFRRQANKVVFCVYDNGPGIAHEQQQHIFEEFTQLNGQSRNEGLGIGLTIVKGICALIDVQINVQSRLHHGSLFSLVIPRCNIEALAPVTPTSQLSRIPTISIDNTLTIWLLENDAQVANAMRALCEHWEVELRWFNRQQALLDAVRAKDTCDVLIVDYHLDHGELGTVAWDLACSLWQAQDAQPPFGILTTADKSLNIRELAKDLNLQYLAKPIQATSLKRLLALQTLV
jgi:signal transduction histidine kinase